MLYVLLVFLGVVASGFIVATIRLARGKSLKSYTFTANDVAKAEAQVRKESRLHRLLVAFDIFCNILFLNGQQDETISAHSWRAAKEGKIWGCVVCAWLNLFEADHGAKAATGDLERAEERVDVEKKFLKVG